MIREMQERDVEAVARMEKEVFASPWSEKSFRDALHGKDTIYLVAVEGEAVVGYCGIWISYETGDLCNMAVLPSCRRHHFGQGLLSEAMRFCAGRQVEHLFLEVREGNVAAIAFYQKMGFQKIGMRKHYYHKPTENAVLMKCEISRP